MGTKPAPKEEINKLLKAGKTTLVTSDTSISDLIKIGKERWDLLKDVVNNPINQPFMLLASEKESLRIHTVYLHKESDGTVMYVGIGGDSREGDYLLRRDNAHASWMIQQVFNNRDYIDVVHTHLTKKEARDIERKLIKEYDTVKNGFNKR